MLYTCEEFDCFAPSSNEDMEKDFLKVERESKALIKADKDWGSENLSDEDIVNLLLEEQKLGWTLSNSDMVFISRV